MRRQLAALLVRSTRRCCPCLLRAVRPCSGEGNGTRTKGLEMDDVLLDMVDFTWLRAGGGWWVNLLRPQSDSTCIDDCLQRALRSDSELLRERSIELLEERLGVAAGTQYRVAWACGLPQRRATRLLWNAHRAASYCDGRQICGLPGYLFTFPRGGFLRKATRRLEIST